MRGGYVRPKCRMCGEEHRTRDDRKACELFRQRAIAKARKQFGTDELEIDDNAKLSIGDDGTWVQAWVWVANCSHPDEQIQDTLTGDRCLECGAFVTRTA